MTTHNRKTILVVDDEPNLVQVIRIRLEANNYLVLTACDGLDALEKVRAKKPNLIILDILMPRMDGATFLNNMKKEGLSGGIPIIVLTAKANMREYFLVQDGVVEFMVKPFQAQNLLVEISRHLQADGNPASANPAGSQ